ncbi:MAG: DUF4174 domain-containing protein [Paracoccaceae bacterium]
MNPVAAFVFALFLTAPAVAADLSSAQEAPPPEVGPYDSSEATLEEFLWLKRPVVVFADTPADPRFREQMELLGARLDALADRDVVILTDTDPAAKSALRMKLRPRGFMLVLIGKDGGVKLRKPAPWDVRELGRVIDKMPMRQQELRDRRKTGS